ncbi:MAG: FtsX-like permease family protein [Ferrovibrio sp.]|uniref:ABC transporter permease n=1 Tax=Ferrovibrio sp. TaxID=1917215 RepID=UPI00261BB7A5|nr:FtsX-like permease family protein [Ferrovibrio sp.]MCW0235806.1 FtsX-like permease family protein [Ferrovibrio sp.]
MLSLRFSLRELRGGLRGFRLFVACLGLGVAVIAGIGTLSASIVTGLERDGRSLLGGDVEFRLIHRGTTAQEQTFLQSRGSVSETVQMRAMAHALRSDERTLVELKAVDAAYPLYGKIDLEQPGDLADLLAAKDGGLPGAAVDPQALIRLNAQPGDRLGIGEAEFEIRAVIAREPDRATDGLTLGPRVMIAADALQATQLVQPGTLAYWHYRVKLRPGLTAAQMQDIAQKDFAASGWRIRDWKEGSPGIRRFLDRAGLFLVLVGLTALLIGGVGVANAVHAHLDGKTPTIATLKSLGATTGLIFRVYLWQTLLLAAFGIGIGLVAGAALPNLAAGALAEVLPLPLVPGFYWQPLALAAAYGLLVALAFTIWPLARAAEIRPAALYRDLVAPGKRLPRPAYVITTLLLFAALAALAIFGAEERRFAGAFVFAAIVAFVLFRLIAIGIARTARHIRPRNVRLKLAFASLHRPGAATSALLLSLGVSLTLLVAIALVESNLHAQVEERLPDEAPAFFFVDIQPAQMDDFRSTVLGSAGARDLETVPNMRGRIASVKGVPAEQIEVSPDQRWVLQGDRGLTYARDLPAGSTLLAGQWWPRDYDGPPLISIEDRAAKGLGVTVGDKLVVNVLGRDIEAEVASIRQLDWSSFGINFVLVFSPGLLERAPHTFLATVKAGPAAELALFRAVTQKFPNISVVRMKDVLTELNTIVLKLGAAVRGAAAITLIAGLIVLAGALAAEHRRRLKEGAILKALGATRRDVILAHVIEYGSVGLVGAVMAFGLGWAAAWAMVTLMMNATFYFAPGVAAATALGGVAATLLLGLAGAWQALAAKPAPLLRTA